MSAASTSVQQQNPQGFGRRLLDDFLILNYRYEVVIGTYVLDFWERMSLKKLNYQYEVTTGLYMLESWEKYIVNGVVCASFALVAYTAINHLPLAGTSLFQQLTSYVA
ncbi:hypothetical protein GGI10_003193 [Coemansia sp. RSA 2530]|nr:hypothetical protein GGI10_003193 [Coemansia sp. RSA 2530]